MINGLQAYNIEVTIGLGGIEETFDLVDTRCRGKTCKIKIVEKGKPTFFIVGYGGNDE